jgi:hypothetical protein
MGHWHRETLKEYIQKELTCYATGMSKNMEQKFVFVIIAGNALQDITNKMLNATDE